MLALSPTEVCFRRSSIGHKSLVSENGQTVRIELNQLLQHCPPVGWRELALALAVESKDRVVLRCRASASLGSQQPGHCLEPGGNLLAWTKFHHPASPQSNSAVALRLGERPFPVGGVPSGLGGSHWGVEVSSRFASIGGSKGSCNCGPLEGSVKWMV